MDFSKSGPEAKNVLILDKIIKGLLYTLIALMPVWFLPITVNAVNFNKQVLMVFLIVLALILWLAKLLSKGSFSLKKNKLNWAILSFFVIYVLATIFSLRPYGSLMGFSGHLSGALINVFSLIALYILIVNTFKGLKEAFSLLFTFLVSSTIVIVFGILQILGKFIFSWSFAKVASFNTIGSVNTLGIFSAVIVSLCIALILSIKKTGLKIFSGVLALLGFLVVFLINFWVIWVVLGTGIAILAIFGLAKLQQSKASEAQIGWLVLPMIVLAITLLFILFSPVTPFNLNLPAEVGLSHKGSWDIVKQTIAEKPILGTGPESFLFNYAKYKSTAINQTAFWNVKFNNPGAEIFSILSDTGILGFLSFLSVIGLTLYLSVKRLIKNKEKTSGIELGIFAGWMSLLVSWFLYSQSLGLMFVFWLLLSFLAVGFSSKTKEYNLKTSSKTAITTSFAFVVIVLIAVSLLYLQGTRFVAEAKYKSGLDLIQQEGKLEKGITKISRATIINSYEDRTYRDLAQLFLAKVNQAAADQKLSQDERINKIQTNASRAINSANRATELSSNNVRNWLVRGDIYSSLMGVIGGADAWAITSFKRATELEPNNPFIHSQLGMVYITIADTLAVSIQQTQEQKKPTEELVQQRNDYLNMAAEAFNKAIEIKSDYSPAHFNLAMTYERQGKIKEAIAKMEGNRNYSPQDVGIAFQLAMLYYRDSQFEKASQELKRTIFLNPDHSNARYFLGLLLDKENKKEEAIIQFERIKELNPDNQLIEQILANLRAGKPALGTQPAEQPEQLPIEQEKTEQEEGAGSL